MAKKKGVRRIITLECTEAKEAGASPSRYTTQVSIRVAPRVDASPCRDPAFFSTRGSPPPLPTGLQWDLWVVTGNMSRDTGS